MTSFQSRSQLGFAGVLAMSSMLLFQAACSKGASSDAATQSSADAAAQAAVMQHGLDLVYKTNDPIDAVDTFRVVLKMNPTHYGARFQLAKALDLSGKPTEARPVWNEVLTAAEAINDTATLAAAKARLAQPDTVSQAGMMAVGLNLLYVKGNAAAAADEFKQVLAKNPTHYGANFQLAKALDQAGKPDEARPYWKKMLTMAQAIKDQPTIDAATTRLQGK
jgi:Tfp pilus assembly protein PilF